MQHCSWLQPLWSSSVLTLGKRWSCFIDCLSVWMTFLMFPHCVCVCSVMSDSLTPRIIIYWLLCPWDFPGKNTGVGCHFLLQEVFLIQGSNPGLLHWRRILYQWWHLGSRSLQLDSS
ncbi:unnamed protein product [Rangifer tarandus platyrhynchus]|uniref:Uncharacterized protein n=1 Tax=Rangifer tarandus platyrhynchus TaxID=3082113 RepID=A0AC59YAG3_RANTA